MKMPNDVKTGLYAVTARSKHGPVVYAYCGRDRNGFDGVFRNPESLLDATNALRCADLARIDGFTEIEIRHVSLGNTLLDAETRQLRREKLILEKNLSPGDVALLTSAG